ncbi:hypothetical protein I4F81_007388 [Pyropia yezoensis]|uniref:Uncharacterized protein n=1 Tax=Pyropia yezoensis TaxID=2788 RepID=A0ACC3C4G2_PYRYE|nr:hypothetical protein I4F81_007388 [Neopyropia yezoensis]
MADSSDDGEFIPSEEDLDVAPASAASSDESDQEGDGAAGGDGSAPPRRRRRGPGRPSSALPSGGGAADGGASVSAADRLAAAALAAAPRGALRFKLLRNASALNVCLFCSTAGHTHLTCPRRPCYICKRHGHLSADCPHRAVPYAHLSSAAALLRGRTAAARPPGYTAARQVAAAPHAAAALARGLALRPPILGAGVVAAGVRLLQRRVTVLEFPPGAPELLVAADKRGNVALWRHGVDLGVAARLAGAAAAGGGGGGDGGSADGGDGDGDGEGGGGGGAARRALHYTTPARAVRVHHANITAVVFDPARSPDAMYTTSGDGSVLRVPFDLAAVAAGPVDQYGVSRRAVGAGGVLPHATARGPAATATVHTAYAPPTGPPPSGAGAPTHLLNLNPRGWTSDVVMAGGMALHPPTGALYVGDDRGQLHTVDSRVGGGGVAVANVHRKGKVNTVDVCAREHRLLATAGNDHAVRLWDVRMLGGRAVDGAPRRGSAASRLDAAALGAYTATRVMNSAYFSPATGSRLLATCQDNRLRVWDVHAFGAGAPPSTELVHSHDFNQYLSPFKAVWQARPSSGGRDDYLFAVGRYLGEDYPLPGPTPGTRRLHPIDIYSLGGGSGSGATGGGAARGGVLLDSLHDHRLRHVAPVNRFHPAADMIASGSSFNVYLWGHVPGGGAPAGVAAVDDDDPDAGGGDSDDSDAPRRKKKKAAAGGGAARGGRGRQKLTTRVVGKGGGAAAAPPTRRRG